MLESLDDPHFQASSTTTSNTKNYIITFGLLFLQGMLLDQLSWIRKDEWGLVLVFVVLPFLAVYFLLPVFILAIVQILLYWVVSLPFWEEGKGWWLRLNNWQQQCTYWVVLISYQVIICCYLVYQLMFS